MSLFSLFAGPNYKKTAKEDFAFWGLMSTTIATNSEFLNRFPPSDECCNMFEQKDWLFAAFLNFLFAINLPDKELANVLVDNTFPLMESYDASQNRKLRAKLMFWQEQYKGLMQEVSAGPLDRVKTVLAHLRSTYCLHAFLWLFCKMVIQKITSGNEPHDYDYGADYLYEQFTKFVMSSKTIQLYNSKLSR